MTINGKAPRAVALFSLKRYLTKYRENDTGMNADDWYFSSKYDFFSLDTQIFIVPAGKVCYDIK